MSFVNREAAATDGFWRQIGRVVRLPLSPRWRPAWAWLELGAVTAAAKRARVEVVHSPANFGPVGGGFARVLTVHDLLFRRHPELLSATMRWGTEALLPAAVRRAHQVITVSQSARDDLIRLLAVSPDRVGVVPNGFSPPRHAGDADAARRILEADARPICLCVASDLPHKNLPLLVHALAVMDPGTRPVLAFAGHGTDAGKLPALGRRLGVSNDLRFLGAVAPPRLEDLYAAADVVVTPTRFEGFGLPILEALGRGIPVAASDLPVLREVAGDAAAWFDPHDSASAASAISRALSEGDRRRLALELARRFSWDDAAARTVELYRQAIARAQRT